VAKPGTYAGAYGILVLAQDGSYTYSLNHGAANVESLAQGQSVVDSFTYVTTDGIAEAASSLAITITGTNDAPLVAADAARVSEDGQLTASGNVLANDSDVDAGTALKVAAPGTYTGAYGTLTIAQDGSYTYNLNNGAANVQALEQGQTVVDSFAYAATDGVASTASSLDITITGASDMPVSGASTNEDKLMLVGKMPEKVAGHAIKANAGIFVGDYGVLTIVPGETYLYALGIATKEVQSLARGASVVDHFEYTAMDGKTKIASAFDVTILGLNDAPTVATHLANRDVALGKAFSFQIPANSFVDIDKGDTLTYTATLTNGSALPSWLKFDAVTGTFNGTAPDKAGSVAVRVTATDRAADGSTVGSLSVSDVFTLNISRNAQSVSHGESSGGGSLLAAGLMDVGAAGSTESSLGFDGSVSGNDPLAQLVGVKAELENGLAGWHLY